MLTNPTIETLKSLKLQGMIQALEEQQQNAAVNALFEDTDGNRYWLYRQGIYAQGALPPRWYLHGLSP